MCFFVWGGGLSFVLTFVLMGRSKKVPSESYSCIRIPNGCQMCVRGDHGVSVFHVSSQRDE